MFTGLIQKTGELLRLDVAGDAGRLELRAEPWPEPFVLGESIAVQGVCLTLTEARGGELRFDVLKETLDRTCLGGKVAGARLNLERSLRVGDPMGGHMVTGHVDGTGVVKTITRVGRDWAIEVTCGDELLKGMVPKGSIACDGISLTIVDVKQDSVSVHIIPHTWANTSLSDLRKGDRINLETDVIGKYVRKQMGAGGAASRVTEDLLRQAGFM